MTISGTILENIVGLSALNPRKERVKVHVLENLRRKRNTLQSLSLVILG